MTTPETEAPAEESFEALTAEIMAEESKPEGEKPPVETAPETVEGGEEETEESEGETEEGEGEEEVAASAEEQAEPQPKKKTTWAERERAAKEEYKAKATDLEKKLAKAEAEKQALVDAWNKAIEGAKPTAETTEDDEPIDTATFNKVQKVDSEVQALKNELAETKFHTITREADTLGAAHLAGYEDGKAFLIAKNAHLFQLAASSMDIELDNDAAIEVAVKQFNNELKEIMKKGKTSGAIAKHIYQKAQALGFSPEAVVAASPKAGSKVNMAAVNKARETAGAPAIKKASAESQKFSFANLVDQIKREDAAAAAN